MNINIILLKQISILSAIFGAILAVLGLIPFVRGFALMTLVLITGAIILIYMKKKDLIGIFDVKEGALIGAIAGFVSCIAFLIVFMPATLLLGAIFKLFGVFYYTYGLANLFELSGFFVLIMLVFFLALLSALMNAFSGLLTAYIYETLLGIKKEQNKNIEFEIKE